MLDMRLVIFNNKKQTQQHTKTSSGGQNLWEPKSPELFLQEVISQRMKVS